MKSTLLFASALAFATAIPALASVSADVSEEFPSPTSTVIDSGADGSGYYCCFWEAARGDSITQAYTGTGLGSITGLDLSFTVPLNVLNSGAVVDWNVMVNGITVGSWVWTQADGTGPVNLAYNFASIAGMGDYTIEMAVTNNVPPGDGSIAISNTGLATLVSTSSPEPATFGLFGVGLLGLGVLARRRRDRS